MSSRPVNTGEMPHRKARCATNANWWDAGFQLSFMGTLGIVLLTPIFQRWLRFLEPIPGGHVLGEIMAVTMAAQVATLPLLGVDFHQISLIAPLANILTVPLLGLLIGVGLLVCGAGLLATQFGIICGWLEIYTIKPDSSQCIQRI